MTILYIAAGCFWGTERYYQKIKGVVTTEVGYANGPTATTNYQSVCAQDGFVEVAKIVFDESVLTFEALFATYIRIVDPYALNKQANDVGVNYRIGLYSEDVNVLGQLETILRAWEKAHALTTIEIKRLVNYVVAEKYHQNYLKLKPDGYCHINLTNIPLEYRK